MSDKILQNVDLKNDLVNIFSCQENKDLIFTQLCKLSNYVFSDPPDFESFFNLWKNEALPKSRNFIGNNFESNSSNEKCISFIQTLSYPILLTNEQNNQPFISLKSLFTTFSSFSIKEKVFYATILHFSLLFQSPSSDILSSLLASISSCFLGSPTASLHSIFSYLNAELIIPFSTAAMYEFNVINSFQLPGILALPSKLFNSFKFTISSIVNHHSSLYTLLDNIYSKVFKNKEISPDPALTNELFTELINVIRKSLLDPKTNPDELWEFFEFHSIPRNSPPQNFSPLMYQFEPVEISNTISLNISNNVSSCSSQRKFPLLTSNISKIFDPLNNLNKGSPAKTKPILNSVILGGPNELLNFLIGFVNSRLNSENSRLNRIFSVITILENNFRFSKYLNENDSLIRSNSSGFIHLVNNIFPKISLTIHTNILDQLIDSTAKSIVEDLPNDLWRQVLSPFTLLNRYLSFYSECAKRITNIPIWIVLILNKEHKKFSVPFIDSVIFSSQSFNGVIRYQKSIPSGEKVGDVVINSIQQNVVDIKLLNMDFPSELNMNSNLPNSRKSSFVNSSNVNTNGNRHYDHDNLHRSNSLNNQMKKKCFMCSIEDDSLIYEHSFFNESSQIKNRNLVSMLRMKKSQKDNFINLTIDSVLFEGIIKFKVMRLKYNKTNENMYFPIRHFEPFDNLFEI